MRADRLLALLLLLQSRGRMTAAELAIELEVSERTIYRDLIALSSAGVPVYTERGPGGGCALVENYQTRLTGLKEAEVRSLSLLSVPQTLVELGLGQELKTALLKLQAALPRNQADQEAWERERVHLDPVSWGQPGGFSSHLPTLHQAVLQERRVCLTYQPAFVPALTRLVDPYGLVAKGDTWHLVAAREGSPRVYPASQILAAETTGETFTRPSNFNLVKFWTAYCAAIARQRPTYPVILRVSSEIAPYLFKALGEGAPGQAKSLAPPGPDGWLTLELTFSSLIEARSRLAGLGGAVEVLEPQALRLSLIDLGEQIRRRYQDQPD